MAVKVVLFVRLNLEVQVDLLQWSALLVAVLEVEQGDPLLLALYVGVGVLLLLIERRVVGGGWG